MLSKEARAERAAYARAWRKAHPGRNAEACRRYWERRAAREAAAEKEGEQDDETV